jgi:hypothetical protein
LNFKSLFRLRGHKNNTFPKGGTNLQKPKTKTNHQEVGGGGKAKKPSKHQGRGPCKEPMEVK